MTGVLMGDGTRQQDPGQAIKADQKLDSGLSLLVGNLLARYCFF